MTPKRSDPIHDKYFEPQKKWEKYSNWGFFLGAVLSFVLLVVNEKTDPILFKVVSISFVLVSIGLFALGLSIRLLFAPTAEDRRREEFFSTAFDVSLIADRTIQYYNNNVPVTQPIRKAAAQTLENSFFSKHVAARMFFYSLWSTVAYLVLWTIVLLTREIPLGFAIFFCQVIFSEQIIAKVIRLYWFKARCDDTYKSLRSLFISKADERFFDAHALTFICAYECTKSYAGTTLSSKIFSSLNEELSEEWRKDRPNLGI